MPSKRLVLSGQTITSTTKNKNKITVSESGNRIFPPKIQEISFPSIREQPFPGPDSVLSFGTGYFPVSFQVGKHSGIPEHFPNENYYINITNQEKSRVVSFIEVFRENSQNRVLLETFSNGTEQSVQSRLFPRFFPDFLEQRDQKKVVFSRYRQFGK